MAQFLANYSPRGGYASNTHQSYLYDLRRCALFLREQYPGKGEPRYSHESLQAFLEKERLAGASPRTLARRLVVIRRFVKFLAQNRRVSADFSNLLRITTGSNGRVKTIVDASPLTQEEIQAIRQALARETGPRALRDGAIFEALLDTGLSVAAILELNISDVGKLAWGETASAMLAKYLAEARPDLDRGRDESALFVSQLGRRMTRQTVWVMLRTLGNATGMKTGLSPRRIRHTAIARMAAEGLNADQLQNRLGYRTPVSIRMMLERLEPKK